LENKPFVNIKLKNWQLLLLFSNIIAVVVVSFILISATKPNSEKSFNKNTSTYANEFQVQLPKMPEKLDFAGEEVPLNNWEVYERVERELIENTHRHAKTFLIFKRAGRYFPVIEPILKKNSIPADFLYLCVIESELSHVVSPAGAAGFWQFMKNTAVEYNLEVTDEVDERYHIEKSTQAACDYFNKAFKKFNNWTLVAASYNMGMTGLENKIAEQFQNKYYDLDLSNETTRYLARILALKIIFQNPGKYFFQIENEDLYPAIPVKKIAVNKDINNLASFAIEHGTNLKMLKELNPWLRKSSLKNPNQKGYIILIPDNKDLNYKEEQRKNPHIFNRAH
jgi:hypothetical protein